METDWAGVGDGYIYKNLFVVTIKDQDWAANSSFSINSGIKVEAYWYKTSARGQRFQPGRNKRLASQSLIFRNLTHSSKCTFL